MPGEPITDPIAVKAVGELLRPAAEAYLRGLALARQILAEWRPAARDLGAHFPEGGGVVVDGREAEGVTPVTVAQARAFHALCERLDAQAKDDRDPATGEPTGMSGEDLLRAFAVRGR